MLERREQLGVALRAALRQCRVDLVQGGHRLAAPDPGLRLAEDLGLDSLDRLQAVMLLEEVLQVKVDDGLLPDLRTLGDVLRIVASVAQGDRMEPAAG